MQAASVIQSLFAMALSFFLGLLVVTALWPPSLKLPMLPRFSLSFPVGVGLSSLLYFITLTFAGSNLVNAMMVETVILLVLTAVWLKSRRPSLQVVREPWSIPEDKLSKSLLVIVACLSVANLTLVLWLMRLLPFEAADAIGLYDLRAKYIYFSGSQWSESLSPLLSWSHIHQPLLLPSFIARTWLYAGQELIFVPQFVSIAFAASCLGLLYWGVSIFRSHAQALLALCFFLTAPLLAFQGSAMLSDMPLATLVLAGLVLFAVLDITPGTGTEAGIDIGGGANTVFGINTARGALLKTKRILMLVGVALGLAAWTKCEGMLVLAGIFVARIAHQCPKIGLVDNFRQHFWFFSGLAAPLFVLVLFKTTIAVSHFSDGTKLKTFLAQLVDLAIMPNCSASALHSAFLAFSPIMLVFAYSCMFRSKDTDNSWSKTGWFTIGWVATTCAIIIAISGIILHSANPLHWAVCSMERLFMQLWPSIVFLVFSTANDITQYQSAQKEVRVLQ